MELPWHITIIITYLIAVNLFAVIITILDKYRAVHHGWRVKEATLLLVSAFGGAVGMYITMHIIRHKTRKLKFMIGIPAIFLAEVFVILLISILLGK
ncbi:MAG TPA: DUF1294 domain-containing protein [Clostridiales bacterium]|nr:DUF1294 domain-containing protein [Clostridiales bacterium]